VLLMSRPLANPAAELLVAAGAERKEVSQLGPNLFATTEPGLNPEYRCQDKIWENSAEFVGRALRRIRTYGFSYQQHLYYLKRVISASISDDGTVLDLGPSNNPRLHYFAMTRGIMGVGVDISLAACRAQAAVGNYLHDHTAYLCANVATLPLPDGCADTIIATDILEHLVPADKPRFFATVTRLLRPGGRLIIRSPLEKDIPWSWNAVLARMDPTSFWLEREAVGHFPTNAFSKDELFAWAAASGLQIQSFRHFNFCLEKMFDYKLLPWLRRLLTKQTLPSSSASMVLGSVPTLAELTAPRLRRKDALLAVCRGLLLWPDRVAAALGGGNHCLAVFSRK